MGKLPHEIRGDEPRDEDSGVRDFLAYMKANPPWEPQETRLGSNGIPAPRENELHGVTIGDFELLEEIGRGGMGVVYKAHQLSLDRIVVLKMILAGPAASEEDVRRFTAEARAAAALSHKNIVEVYQTGECDGRYYYAMAYVRGRSLAERLKAGIPTERVAVALVMTIADAVQHAHDQKVVHRDLKPANILLDDCGEPRVTDFGLAKRMQADASLTGTRQILGTPSYMAPEQATRGANVGPAADIYALGAILYRLLIGRPPFEATDPADALYQLIHEEPLAPRVMNPSIPQDLETICLKCLQKAPERRYKSASDLSADLNRYLEGRPIHARPIGRLERSLRWCKRRPGRAAAIVSVLFAVIVVGSAAVSNSRLARLAEAARQDATQVFDWTSDSLGNLENAVLSHAEFPADEKYRDLQRQLLEITMQHYAQITRLKSADARRFPVLEYRRGDAHSRLGTVELRYALDTSSHQLRRIHLSEALSRFTEARAIFTELYNKYPEDAKFEFRTGWSCGWQSYVLHELGRYQEAILAAERGISVLGRCSHPEAPVKLGACYLERAVIAAKTGDVNRANSFLELSIRTLDDAAALNDGVVQADWRFYRTVRMREVPKELLQSGAHQAAVAMFERLSAKSAGDPWSWYEWAIVQLARNDKAAYRHIRAEILKRFGAGDEPSDRVAYVYAPVELDGSSSGERSALVRVAERLTDPRARAGLLYRLGRFPEAIACFQERNYGRGWDHLVLAMSYYRSNERAEALRSFRAALDWLRKVDAGQEKAGWNEMLETRLLLDETRKITGFVD